MERILRVRYEGGVLRPLDALEAEEGEELLIVVKGRVKRSKRFYRLVEEAGPRPQADIDRILDEVRGRAAEH